MEQVFSSPSGPVPDPATKAQSTDGAIHGATSAEVVVGADKAKAKERSGADGGRLACRRVLCRWVR